jgi:hypothetical protein
MKNQAMTAMVNGLMAQLTISVTEMPRQCLPTCPSDAKVDLDQHRNDHQPDQHRNRQVHTGDLSGSDCLEERRKGIAKADAGNNAQATQSVRYRSNVDIAYSCSN